MAYKEEMFSMTPAQKRKFNKHKQRHPNIVELKTMLGKVKEQPDSYYDHVNDLVYINMKDANGNNTEVFVREDHLED